jgi:hypothetical protein
MGLTDLPARQRGRFAQWGVFDNLVAEQRECQIAAFAIADHPVARCDRQIASFLFGSRL